MISQSASSKMWQIFITQLIRLEDYMIIFLKGHSQSKQLIPTVYHLNQLLSIPQLIYPPVIEKAMQQT